MSDAAAAAFWRFSLAIYARPGVPADCLKWQDEHGRDVNVALYCCWLGLSGRGALSSAALAAADARVAPWRHQIVEKLRDARRAIKVAAAEGSESLYSKAKAVELEAERQLQRQLASLAPAPDRSLSSAARISAALANLRLYVGTAPAGAVEEALRQMAEEDFSAAG